MVGECLAKNMLNAQNNGLFTRLTDILFEKGFAIL
jgi:hypothetical protein